MGKIKWFIDDFFTRHTNIMNRLLHFAGIPQAFFGIFQLITGQWKWGLLNFFLGYLWQWIGHKYFDKNEAGEVILMKKIIGKIRQRTVTSIFLVCILFIGGDAMALMIKSPAFNDGDTMPAKYTCKGEDISPPLMWEHPPDGTASFAIICDDPDAPMGAWSHWVIYNILKGTDRLPEGVPPYEEIENGAKQGMNDFQRIGYGGPCPPLGVTHRYFFRLYALDQILDVETGLTRDRLFKAMNDHIIEETGIMVKFKR